MPGPGKPFAKGNPGRPKGATNLVTRTVKELVAGAVDAAQRDPAHPANLRNFAVTHPKEFWQVASKLIPEEIKATLAGQVRYEVGVVVEAMGATPAPGGGDPDGGGGQ